MLAQSKSLAYVKELCVLGIGQDLVVSPPFVRDCAGSNALDAIDQHTRER